MSLKGWEMVRQLVNREGHYPHKSWPQDKYGLSHYLKDTEHVFTFGK